MLQTRSRRIGAGALALAMMLGAGAAALPAQSPPAQSPPAGTSAVAALPAELAGFDLDFVVLYRADDPGMALRPAGIPNLVYNVASWRAFDPARADLATSKRDDSSQGDGFDDRILDGRAEKRSADYFNSGERIHLAPARIARQGSRLIAHYPADPRFTLTAEVDLAAKPYPLLRWHLTAKVPGNFSVGYVGAPQVAPAAADEVWQPLVWQEKRMPDRAYLTMAYRAPLPTAMVRRGGTAYAAIAHPSEFPFQPLPTADNSRFGVAVRTEDGQASPQIFAPVMGGAGSKLAAGASTGFSAYLVRSEARDLTQLYERLARTVYGFRDYRSNAVGSLNAAFDTITDYSMSAYARWIAELKGSSYSTDVPGAVKNVSSLNPLMLALVTDRRDIFDDRVVPYVEFMLSREKFLFSLDPEQKIQHPSRQLLGPAAPVSELAALYDIFDRRNPAYLALARGEFEGNRTRNLDVAESGRTWPNALSLYTATGDRALLAEAVAGADRYLQRRVVTPATRFEDGAFFFWPEFVPDFVDLYRLYEATGARRFLAAAQSGARRYAMFVWMAPAIPDATVTVNPGGKAPVYWYLKGKGHTPMSAPEEQVPAWRLSEIGLTAESSGTSTGHRAIFMANYAPWMLRIGADAQDGFLRDIAKAAIIGRYRNFPGYHINTARTTIYEAADYPLHDHKQLSVNSFHYNHIWPMATMLLDYLVSDAHVRSGGAIDFPAQFIEGYAYLQNGFYGHRAGRFHGDRDVWLWMPRGLVKTDASELNYVAGYRGDALYLAFANQSDTPVTARFTLAADRVQRVGRLRVMRLSPAGTAALDGEGYGVTVPAGGQVALRIDGLRADARFQRAMRAGGKTPVAHDEAGLGFGDARAYLLDFGALGRRGFVYLRDDDRSIGSATLRYRDASGTRQELTDTSFPFEFSVPLPAGAPFAFRLSGVKTDGSRDAGVETVLGR
ncbi:hypothetical protein [Sphingomonas sanxanigenens]|uniref:hypothetical protein n=1 Tax=Sphingomonas sanxanigenens TaxID=397260 RepID=UPI00130135A5|nr:hypothetical protein [Sphingomonas sanxanigenens]